MLGIAYDMDYERMCCLAAFHSVIVEHRLTTSRKSLADAPTYCPAGKHNEPKYTGSLDPSLKYTGDSEH